MARPTSSDTHFPCGHTRLPENLYIRGDLTPRCLTCRREKAKAYRDAHPEYFARYRAKLRTVGYQALYMDAWRKGTERPRVKDLVKREGLGE